MPFYDYRARDLNGQESTGRFRADDPDLAAAILRERGLFVIALTPAKLEEPDLFSKLWNSLRPVSARSLGIFFRRLESLMIAGYNVHEALLNLELGQEDKRVKRAVQEMIPQVAQGFALSDLMELYPIVFGPHAVALLRAGEQAGEIPQMAGQIAEHYERESRIWRSLRWPLGLLVFALIPTPVFLSLVRFVRYWFFFQVAPETMPAGRFEPWLNALIHWFIHDGLTYAFPLTILIVLLLMAGQIALHYPGWRKQRDRLALTVPYFGGLTRASALARFLRCFIAAFHAGTSFHEALRIGGDAAANTVIKERITPQIPLVREGKKVAAALDEMGFFPGSTIGLIATGEATGRVEESLTQAMEDIENYRDTQVKKVLVAYWFIGIFYAALLTCVVPAFFFAFLYGGLFDMVDQAFGVDG